jgi:uncharacterized protein YndB with AHSA1/START domain
VSTAPNPVSSQPESENIVHRSVTVKTTQQHAFDVFTENFDSWWPRSHHIGKSPMKRAGLEGRVGGRCYSQQEDGTDCPWGEITEWDPPRRLVIAWKINTAWQYEPDPAKSSDVEVLFTALPDGTTRVDLQHRNFERLGSDWTKMRDGVSSQGGWHTLLQLFATQAEKSA